MRPERNGPTDNLGQVCPTQMVLGLLRSSSVEVPVEADAREAAKPGGGRQSRMPYSPAGRRSSCQRKEGRPHAVNVLGRGLQGRGELDATLLFALTPTMTGHGECL